MRRFALLAASVLFVTAGCLHFVQTAAYLRIMPPRIPWPLAMIYVSGAAEIAGGIGLLLRPLRRAAGWGLTALLIAVFPANIYMATAHIQLTAAPLPDWLLWARLPLQALLIWWVLWCSWPGSQRPQKSESKIGVKNRSQTPQIPISPNPSIPPLSKFRTLSKPVTRT